MADYEMTILDQIPEGSSPAYSFRVRWKNGLYALLADFATALLTVIEETTGAFVNSRHNQNILGVNQVAFENITEDGVTYCKVTWSLTANDTACLTTRELENHIATFKLTKTDGDVYNFSVTFPIVNLNLA